MASFSSCRTCGNLEAGAALYKCSDCSKRFCDDSDCSREEVHFFRSNRQRCPRCDSENTDCYGSISETQPSQELAEYDWYESGNSSVTVTMSPEISEVLDGHGESIRYAVDSYRDTSKRLGRDLITAAVVGPIVGAVVSAFATRAAQTNEHAVVTLVRNRQLFDLLDSLHDLEKKFGELDRNFAIDRSVAYGANRELRGELLNELQYLDVVEEERRESASIIRIRHNTPELERFYNWFDTYFSDVRRALGIKDEDVDTQ